MHFIFVCVTQTPILCKQIEKCIPLFAIVCLFALRKNYHFTNMRELTTILQEAIEQWEIHTKIHADLTETHKNDEVDIAMEFSHNGKKHRVYIEAKRELRNYQLPEIEKLATRYHHLMIVADNILPKIKEELRDTGIAYLETSGNMYYKDKDLFIWLDGKKPVKKEDEKLGRAFTKTGLKAVFHFLLMPELVNTTYRNIAEVTGVSFGNINFIMTDLKQQGYLLKIDADNFQLNRKKDLLAKWMDAYEHKLKPNLLVGTFRFFNQSDAAKWKQLQLKNMKSWWGGEPGGDLLTNYLQPEIFTVYTIESKGDLTRNYRFVPDPNGSIKVYKKFWNIDEVNDNITPPLLIYIDLINTGDRRCKETAEKIYNELLQDKF